MTNTPDPYTTEDLDQNENEDKNELDLGFHALTEQLSTSSQLLDLVDNNTSFAFSARVALVVGRLIEAEKMVKNILE